MSTNKPSGASETDEDYSSLTGFSKGPRAFDEEFRELLEIFDNSDPSEFLEQYSLVMDIINERYNTSNPFWNVQLLNGRHDFACIVVRNRNLILAANEAATEYFDIGVGTLPSEIILPTRTTHKHASDSVCSAYSWSNHLGRNIQISALPESLTSDTATKELFVLHDPEDVPSLNSFAAKYDLSPTESSILALFFSGKTVNEMAELRCRSVNTVRTQFYTLLGKCDCSNQVQLFQALEHHARSENLHDQAVGFFRDSQDEEYTILGLDGRFINFKKQGAKDGKLVILFRTDFYWCLPEQYNQLFEEWGIQYISLSPPGFGKTSLPLPDETLEEACAKDIAALLAAFNQEKATLHVVVASVVLGLRISSIMPDKINAVTITSLIVPRGRRSYQKNGSWLASTLNMFLDYSFFSLDSVAKSFYIYVGKIGIKRFMANFYAHDKAGFEAIMQPEILHYVETAFAASRANGLEFNARGVRLSVLEDWEDELAKCPVPIHIRLGELDLSGPIDAVESMAADYPDKVFLSTVPGYGMSYFLQTTDPLLGLFAQATSPQR